MKKILLILAFTLTSFVFANNHNHAHGESAQKDNKKMANFRFVPLSKATILQDGKSKNFCPVCGMTLNMFYKTNHAASTKNHTKQYCSIHCAVEDKEVNKNKLSNFKVVDNITLKFIDSKDAYFVVGSKKSGTMSMISKYAFGTKKAAQNFANKNGGDIMKFDKLYHNVKKSLKKEMMMVAKKQKKAAKMGKKIYKKMCKNIDKKFNSTAEAKSYIKEHKSCGNMKGKKLQMVGLYLSK